MSVCYSTYQKKEELSFFVCYQFFKQIRTRFGRKPIIYSDGALWYNNDACKWLRLKHIVYGIDLKNIIIERLIHQQIKDRTECFDDHFPCRIKNCNRQHVINWIKMFVYSIFTYEN
jgi:transposase-like protein